RGVRHQPVGNTVRFVQEVLQNATDPEVSRDLAHHASGPSGSHVVMSIGDGLRPRARESLFRLLVGSSSGKPVPKRSPESSMRRSSLRRHVWNSLAYSKRSSPGLG